MELNWLEDFVELAAVRNFSVAAAARHVTQPAFSRRIRALENWVGIELVDRSSFPVKLTKAGEIFLETGRDLMREIYRLRDDCRQQASLTTDTLTFSALHTIALSIFPKLLEEVQQNAGSFATRISATDFYDCIEALSLGRCEIALCYGHTLGPPILQAGRFESRKIGSDPFLLISAAGGNGAPLYSLDGSRDTSFIPLVAYTTDCFLGKVQHDLIREMWGQGPELRTVFENSMSEMVKRMILHGAGIGWLPESAITEELESGSLVVLDSGLPDVRLDVLVFRRTVPGSVIMERFWAHLPDAPA
ncbi:LysR substrate-binding domain-containing protein [Roseibium litorale]|uniref:LysR family transcriptional regulator n=1 Tax=Roseibium litorale TaxID=2803841 RepID=A0ABR9CLX1_9HYPH|nr:LysR substrate-binding domain-containing protein [Roseibium litorale]MBD8891718.1 LysR family transcriptional regulator [Roseibium litorale]